jgi:hypothetical protein
MFIGEAAMGRTPVPAPVDEPVAVPVPVAVTPVQTAPPEQVTVLGAETFPLNPDVPSGLRKN